MTITTEETEELIRLYREPADYQPRDDHKPYLTEPEPVHRHGCPATSMAKAKKPWKCDCGADELGEKFRPLWRKFVGESP